MQPVEIDDYIRLGWEWAIVINAEAGDDIHSSGGIVERLDTVFEALDTFDLHVTVRAGGDVRTLLEKLRGRAKDAVLTAPEAGRLRELMDAWLQTFNAETTGRVAYQVTGKRLDVHKLLSDVGALFPPGVFEVLPEQAIFDLSQAGKAIAYEMPTAAAFHLMRATEDVLRDFYARTVRRNRIKHPWMWGPMVDSLRKRSAPPPPALLDNLDNIRHNFRNPTQHPEAVYDIHEAQSLFALCIDVIDRMSRA